jgi:uncharacterized circularly permuted ATP-grasp superfamily protein
MRSIWRGPRGQWRVLGDRLRLANGIGYALENRLALSRVTGGLLTEIARAAWRSSFPICAGALPANASARTRASPCSPGRFNQSYPEQAHLARYLGFPLVEGRDLTVSDDRVYVRTIAGPSASMRCGAGSTPTRSIRCASMRARDRRARPVRGAGARGVTLANWPGVEVLEAPAFAAFMPRLFSGCWAKNRSCPMSPPGGAASRARRRTCAPGSTS